MFKLRPEERQFIDELYITQFNMMFSFAQTVMGNEEASREIVQDTFHLACQKIDMIMASPNPQGWLMKALEYKIRRVWREKKQEIQYIAQLPEDFDFGNLADESLPEEDVEILYCDWAREQDFELLREFAVEDKAIKTIAEEHGISIDSCTKRLSRIKEKLRRELKDSKIYGKRKK